MNPFGTIPITQFLIMFIGLYSFIIALRIVGYIQDRRMRSSQCPICGFRTYPDCIDTHIEVHKMKSQFLGVH